MAKYVPEKFLEPMMAVMASGSFNADIWGLAHGEGRAGEMSTSVVADVADHYWRE